MLNKDNFIDFCMAICILKVVNFLLLAVLSVHCCVLAFLQLWRPGVTLYCSAWVSVVLAPKL